MRDSIFYRMSKLIILSVNIHGIIYQKRRQIDFIISCSPDPVVERSNLDYMIAGSDGDMVFDGKIGSAAR